MKIHVRKALGGFYNNTAPGRFIVKNRYYLMAFILPLLILTAAYIALAYILLVSARCRSSIPITSMRRFFRSSTARYGAESRCFTALPAVLE